MTESLESVSPGLVNQLKAVDGMVPQDQLPAFEEILTGLGAQLDQEEQG